MAELRVLEVNKLEVDHCYQRGLILSIVKEIVGNFNPDLLGVLEVSQRNGSYTVIDGQQRLTALKRLERRSARCNVHQGLSPQDEAALFVALNVKRRKVSSLERFLAARFQGDSEACRISKLAEDAGFDIGKCKGGRPETRIEAVATLERIFNWKDGAAILGGTLELIAETWRGDVKSNHTYWLMGIALFIREYGDPVGAQRAKLADVAPAVVMRKAFGDIEGAAGGGGGAVIGFAIADRLRRSLSIRKRVAKRAA